MSSEWGRKLHISIFGESHGGGIGVVLDSPPPGERIDMQALSRFIARRAPGRDKAATPRREADAPAFLSGLVDGVTTGTPLCALICNTDTRSADYSDLSALARPGHADYTGYVRYRGFNDVRGGGHFSGRLTAPLVVAGGIVMQLLMRRGVAVGAHLLAAGGVRGRGFDPTCATPEDLAAPGERAFPVLDPAAEAPMRAAIEEARMAGDSLGGVVECCALGLPAGLGSPMFGGVENVLSSLLFGIPALKGLEFGDAFAGAARRGSENNDAFYMHEGAVRTRTNRHGGVLGGITSGMPLLLRAAFKPTPSISKPQETVDYRKGEDAVLGVKGRHDPCLAVRAVPCVEAAVALGLWELLP